MLDLQSSQFFNALPMYVKESVMQSGMNFDDEEHLRRFTEGLDIDPKR